MNRDELTRQAVHKLVRQQKLGVLSTVGENGPYASLVACWNAFKMLQSIG